MARIPKHCWVRRATIETKGIEVGLDCEGEGSGGSGRFPLTRGQQGFSNYPSAFFPKVRRIVTGDHGEAETTGIGAEVTFQLAPEKVHCKVRGSGAFKSLVCTTKKKTKRRK